MYKSIKLQNFRGIENLEIDDLGKVNLFVGKNNCGKTTILESLFLLTGPSNVESLLNIQASRGMRHIDSYSASLFFNKLDINLQPSIEAILERPKEERTLKIKTKNGIISRQNVIYEDELSTIDYFPNMDFIGDIEFEYSIKRKKERSQTKKINVYVGNEKIEVKSPKDYKENLFGTFLNSKNSFSGLKKNFNNVLIKKKISRVVKTLKKIEPEIESISMGSDGIVYCDIGLKKMIPINVMGDGMVRLLAILLAISNAQNGVVLIDEIENGFHPSSQEILWLAIFEASKEFDTQIFATTHSIEAVRAFNKSYVNSEFEDKIRLFRIEKNNKYNVIKYTPEILNEALDSGWEVR